MAKNVLIFFSFKKHKTGYYNTLFNPLKEQESKYDLRLFQGSLKDLYIEVIDNELVVTESTTGRRLDEFDAVRFELWLKSPQQALAAATYLDRKGIPFTGREALNTLCQTKVGEYVRMSGSGLSLPQTFMSSYSGTLRRFKKNPPISYPFVAKAADTFGGQMNFLVHNYEQLKAALDQHRDQFFLIQEFIPNDCDYRVLIMGGEVKLVMRRSRAKGTDTHLNNTSAGAEGEIVPVNTLSDVILKDALKAAEVTLRSDMAGVDVIIDSDTGRHYILEVNEAPAIQTGANPPAKIAVLMQHMTELANRKRELQS